MDNKKKQTDEERSSEETRDNASGNLFFQFWVVFVYLKFPARTGFQESKYLVRILV